MSRDEPSGDAPRDPASGREAAPAVSDPRRTRKGRGAPTAVPATGIEAAGSAADGHAAATRAAKGIRVNAVAPGPVWTPLNPADSPAKEVAQFGSDVPMKRPAQPEELSPLYVFLASPVCSSYITGEIVPVIGGYQSS